MADNQNLRVAQRFGNKETCIAAVQICRANYHTNPATGIFAGRLLHCTGTFSLKIKRGSMNLRVR
ncbi:hypothetical protein EN962_19485 [Mesorhizobium sp. M7A.F.Ca.CA.001.09.2.1]|uniref:Uncharacterized protein n=1 Tax=Mesorhizobium ciceri biovar biserrulae (strain HAMBI 2942 / LMG 23838 / WSM1271) TaxID=765698 RepID=E8T962_MESCW|nr:hypothetical protein [Mesorhizobium sp. BR1-1-3]ADV14220.1 hypothetical protein Mesci_5120 [Mesorhizobium ciceri biovar biserrulae WSM1271]ARP66779.1 hypothetical protein A9K65_028085 [Mesorhizobium sp. WSM1497]RUU23244.1 hypothetical protein EOC84_02495 [Mesorhizobium sp. Primo-B]RUU35235.1 hypothetical protein EOC83_26025 [Mesorhizobium sp. Primo-A]RUX13145.1 hypothetical protein EN996_21160 [Mesorhizobium sp. M7A.F.Ca.CA.002.14.1.2]RUX39496.1 hypothetical protein EN987_11490 [Mesorhizob